MARSPFTGTNSTLVWGRKDGRAIYRCPDTDAVFFDRDELGKNDYQDFYPYLKLFDTARFDWELRIRRRHYERQLELMRRFVSGTRLLDVGAGPGYLVRVALDQGWDAAGVEVAQEAVRCGQEQFGVRYVRLEEVADGSLDAITCHHVLEHLAEPMPFLELVHRKLRPGGLFVLHVPHQQPLTFVVRDRLRRLAQRGNAETFCSLYGDIHVTGFTGQSLRSVLERCSYRTQFIRTAGMWSMFYDPFFFRSYVKDRAWTAMTCKFARSVLDNAGNTIGLGDWVVGYFARP